MLVGGRKVEGRSGEGGGWGPREYLSVGAVEHEAVSTPEEEDRIAALGFLDDFHGHGLKVASVPDAGVVIQQRADRPFSRRHVSS